MANFGDVALNLSSDWSRGRLHDKRFGLMIVGHDGGVADAYLTDDPDKRHHFVWVEPRYKDEVDLNRTRYFQFVRDTEWTKNENLWEWDAEGFLLCMGQRLMFRDASYYYADEEAKKTQREKDAEDKESNAARKIAARSGIEITEDESPRRSARR